MKPTKTKQSHLKVHLAAFSRQTWSLLHRCWNILNISDVFKSTFKKKTKDEVTRSKAPELLINGESVLIVSDYKQYFTLKTLKKRLKIKDNFVLFPSWSVWDAVHWSGDALREHLQDQSTFRASGLFRIRFIPQIKLSTSWFHVSRR